MTAGQYKAERDPRGYTPTTEDVRDEWRYNIQEVDIDGYVVVSFDEAGAQFDRWLAEHDAKVRVGAIREYVAAARENPHTLYWPASGVLDDAEQWADEIEKGMI